MDFRFSPEEEAFRQELRAWLEENIPPDWEGIFLEEDEEAWRTGRAFVKKLARKGWLAPSWPKEHGGMEASPSLQLVYNEEMGYYRAPIGSIIQAVGYIGPAILFFGTSEIQRSRRGSTCWPSAAAKRCGARASPSRRRAPTWLRSRRGRCETATTT